jgi:hypothetical protein
MLKNKSIFRCVNHVLFLLMVSVFCLPASANLLTNPGFEQPVTNDGYPFIGSWEAFFVDGDSTAVNSLLMPHSGLQSVEMGIDGVANVFAGVFQEVDGLLAGQSVLFSGWHKSLLEQGGIEIRIEFRDLVNDIEISRTPNLVPTVGADYSQFFVNSLIPLGADGARVVYAIQSYGGVTSQLVYVDDFSFVVTDVPEPSILALLGIGLVGLGFVRRK